MDVLKLTLLFEADTAVTKKAEVGTGNVDLAEAAMVGYAVGTMFQHGKGL